MAVLPLKSAFDGGFASHANLEKAKAKGVKDVCFSKARGLDEEDMCRSKQIYKGLPKGGFYFILFHSNSSDIFYDCRKGDCLTPKTWRENQLRSIL